MHLKTSIVPHQLDITVYVLNPSLSHRQHVTVTENGEGTYYLTFVLNDPGEYALSVGVNGKHIPGMPFQVCHSGYAIPDIPFQVCHSRYAGQFSQ